MVERDNVWISHAIIEVEGTSLSPQYMNALLEVVVDTSLHLPSMFVMRFQDDQLELVDANVLTPGKRVKIKFASGGDNQAKTVVTGEITSIEPEYTRLTTVFTVRGYDRSHRLNRGAKTRAFIQMKDSDIVRQIASEAGLQPDVSETSQVFEHIFQDNQTDLAFLQERAHLLGYEVFVEEEKLYFRKPQGRRGNVSLTWGQTLIDFFPRMTLARQVNEVTVKGWDYNQKRAIVGKARNSESATSISNGQSGGTMAQSAFNAANHLIVRQPVVSQAQADRIAQAALNDINAEFVEAEGMALGDPNLVAGKIIKVQNLGQRFSGDYMVTSAVHVYSQDGYEVHFRVEGAYARTMADLVTKSKETGQDHQVWAGVYSAIVTNNSDPQNLGRVKVKFPWMDDTLESGWVRVVGLGAGNQRGLFWLPEVNDEVLIAFEHGEFNHPYVIGNLWNGQDKPPDNTNNVVKGGKVETRLLKTRTGHMIKLVDESGSSYIEIVDHNGNNQIKLDTNNNKLIIKTKGDLEMESTGKTVLKGTGNVSVEGNQNITVKATTNVNIEATANLTLKGTGNVSVESSGTLTIKGAIVKIN